MMSPYLFSTIDDFSVSRRAAEKRRWKFLQGFFVQNTSHTLIVSENSNSLLNQMRSHRKQKYRLPLYVYVVENLSQIVKLSLHSS